MRRDGDFAEHAIENVNASVERGRYEELGHGCLQNTALSFVY
jgi:hypothetical protein